MQAVVVLLDQLVRQEQLAVLGQLARSAPMVLEDLPDLPEVKAQVELD
jgi:hypothetical protein